MSFTTSDGFYNDTFGSTVASGINPVLRLPLAADSWITIGIDSQNTGDEVAISTVEDASQPFASFQAGSAIDGNDIVIDTQTGGVVRLEWLTQWLAQRRWRRFGHAVHDSGHILRRNEFPNFRER